MLKKLHRPGGVVCLLAEVTVLALAAAASMCAQVTTCDATAFNGAYGYKLTGSVYDNQGYVYLLGGAGRLVSDGKGTFTGAHTYSFDGSIVKQQYTGTYSVNSDCTGSLTLTPTSGTATHYDFVIVNGGVEVTLVQTDTGYVLTGDLKQQKVGPAPPAA